MTENLLQSPERGTIEALLQKSNAGLTQAPTFERLLGFISGAVLTPGGFEPSDWMQPLFDLIGVVFNDIDDIEALIAAVMPLYDRVAAVRSRGEKLCPFELDNLDVVKDAAVIIDWATGLQRAVTSQEDIWIPYEGDVDFVDDELKREVNLNIQCLTTLVDPSSIPEIIKDPVPFQRNVLSQCPGWSGEVRETWDAELIEMLKCFCLARLDTIMDSFQRYSTAYDEGDVCIVTVSPVPRET